MPDPAKVRALLMQGLTRPQIARHLRCRTEAVYQAYPVTDMDRLRQGQAVTIGRILAKRCRSCGVTKMLEQFYAKDTVSGCGATCLQCGPTRCA